MSIEKTSHSIDAQYQKIKTWLVDLLTFKQHRLTISDKITLFCWGDRRFFLVLANDFLVLPNENGICWFLGNPKQPLPCFFDGVKKRERNLAISVYTVSHRFSTFTGVEQNETVRDRTKTKTAETKDWKFQFSVNIQFSLLFWSSANLLLNIDEPGFFVWLCKAPGFLFR